MYDNTSQFNEIHTQNYKDIYNKLKPKIDNLISLKTTDFFQEFCILAFRKKLMIEGDYSSAKINTAVIMCLKPDETEQIIKRFKTEFLNFLTNSIDQSDELLALQQFQENQPLQVQFYDPALDLSSPSADLPNFYTSFSDQGLVLSTTESKDPSNVKFSFRYDQIINCRGMEPKIVKDSLDKTVATKFKSNECCIAYSVDWSLKPLNDMFCSLYKRSQRCKLDIKIFQATMYGHCLKYNIKKLENYLKETNGNLRIAKLAFTIRAQMIEIVKEIIKYDLTKYLTKSSFIYKFILEEKVKAKNDLYGLLKGLEDQLKMKIDYMNPNGVIIESEESSSVKKESIEISQKEQSSTTGVVISSDFEEQGYTSERDKRSTGNVSMESIERMKNKFLMELKEMHGGEDEIITETTKTTVHEEVKVKEEVSKVDVALKVAETFMMQLGGMKLSEQEVSIITKLIMTDVSVFQELIKYNIKIDVSILQILMTTTLEDGILRLKKLLKEKTFTVKSSDGRLVLSARGERGHRYEPYLHTLKNGGDILHAYNPEII